MDTSEQLNESIKAHSSYTKNINSKASELDYSLAEKHIPMLNMLDSLKTGIIIVQDFRKDNFFFFSEKFDEHFGFQNNSIRKTNQEWFRKRLNPDDYIINVGCVKGREYIKNIPIEERKNYKLIKEFRILNDNNKWIRVIIQDYILELDNEGNIWLSLKIIDFSPNQDIDAPGSAVLQNSSTGEVIFTMQKESNYNISEREKEVLGLIAKGLKSKDISEKLFISKNTVNNHRRNIIEKLKVANTQEAVSNAKELGII